MKKLFFIALLLISASALRAQNVYNYTSYTYALTSNTDCQGGCQKTLQVGPATTPGTVSSPTSGVPSSKAMSDWDVSSPCNPVNINTVWYVTMDPSYGCGTQNGRSDYITNASTTCIPGPNTHSNIPINSCLPGSVPTSKIKFDYVGLDIYITY